MGNINHAGHSSRLSTSAGPELYFSIMDESPDDPSRKARTQIADVIVTAAERGHTLTLEDLAAAGQPIDALGRDREAQERVVTSWTTRAVELVAKARAGQAADDKRPED